ncbi:MAG: small multi-drug export protein [Clostridia bacterium]|nr:small multi-drug export protein [Clostridia bacterium]MBQ6837445.1 small multi-drug export protein [Clostridia bacterium]
MVETIVTSLVEFLQNTIPPQLVAFAISLCPVLELRGGMIAARLLEIPFLQAFIICYIGNMIPIPFILLFIRKIFAWMRKFKAFAKIVDKMEERSEKKKGTIEKYKEWGLLLFVAIPLPGTGGWTGALIAALLDLRFKKCLPIITLGVFIAGLIMSLITYGIF